MDFVDVSRCVGPVIYRISRWAAVATVADMTVDTKNKSPFLPVLNETLKRCQ